MKDELFHIDMTFDGTVPETEQGASGKETVRRRGKFPAKAQEKQPQEPAYRTMPRAGRAADRKLPAILPEPADTPDLEAEL